jgi:uncharacterized membrane protein
MDDWTEVVSGGLMALVATALTALVALSHVGFMVLEMVFWDHPIGRKIFKMTPEASASSKALALLFVVLAGTAA